MDLDAGDAAAFAACGTTRLQLGTRSVLVIRSDDGLFACDATCTHEDASLADGAVLGDTLECPLHGAVFNLRTGAVEYGPAERALPVYGIRQQDGRVLIDLPETPA